MSTNTLLAGIIGFLLGGLVVSVAAQQEDDAVVDSEQSMSLMSQELEDLRGDDFDSTFIASMIEHHEEAVEMARLAESRAAHAELERLAGGIVEAQESEITQMQRWRQRWGYVS